MGVSRLKRKERANRAVQNNRQEVLKQINIKPVIKNIDVAEIKAAWARGEKVTL